MELGASGTFVSRHQASIYLSQPQPESLNDKVCVGTCRSHANTLKVCLEVYSDALMLPSHPEFGVFESFGAVRAFCSNIDIIPEWALCASCSMILSTMSVSASQSIVDVPGYPIILLTPSACVETMGLIRTMR